MPLFDNLFSIVFAVAMGSFATVLVARVPVGESILGRSKCPSCSNQLPVWDNIPILGYFRLRGKCSHCRARISKIYPAVEIAVASMAAVVVVISPGLSLKLASVIFVTLGVALSVIDFRVKRLPNTLVLALSVALVTLFAIDARSDLGRLLYAFELAVLFSAALGLIRLLSRGGMGMGDVKFAFPLGLAMGYVSLQVYLLGISLAFVLGAGVGIVMLVFGKASRKTALPFGPFLFIGAYISLVLGHYISF